MAAAIRRFRPNAAVKNMAWKGAKEFMTAMAKTLRMMVFIVGPDSNKPALRCAEARRRAPGRRYPDEKVRADIIRRCLYNNQRYVSVCTMGQGDVDITCIGLKMAKLLGVLVSNTGSITEAVQSECVLVTSDNVC